MAGKNTSGEKVRLTRAVVTKLNPDPDGKQKYYYDLSVSGLCVCVNPSGTKTWYLYRKFHGRPVRLKLGRFPDVGPEQARNLATEAAGRMAGGQDVQNERIQRRKTQLTWSDLFVRYLEEHAKVHKKTWDEDEAIERRYLSDWSAKPISSFSRTVVAEKHREVGKDTPTAANRMLSLVSKVFAFADEAGLWDKVNPASRIRKFREISRDRFVTAEEMPKLLAAIRKYQKATIRDFLLICLFTGARRANVMQMQWRQLDLKTGIWRIPDTKSGDPVILPLPDEAQKILSERKKICDAEEEAGKEPSPWVFSSRGKSGHLVEPKTAWATITASIGIKDLKIHDLRRTLGSWQAMAGVSLPIIGKSLGHRTTSATAIYARINLDSVRSSVGSAVKSMIDTIPKTTTSRGAKQLPTNPEKQS